MELPEESPALKEPKVDEPALDELALDELAGQRQKACPIPVSILCSFLPASTPPLQPVMKFGNGEQWLLGSSFVLPSPQHEE